MKVNKKSFWLNFFALTFVMLAVSAVAFIVMYDDSAKSNEQEETASPTPSVYLDNTEASTTIPTVTVILPAKTEQEKVSETQNTSESLSASENQSETSDTMEAQTTMEPITTEKPTTTEAPTTTEVPTTPEPATSEEPTVAPTTTPEPTTPAETTKAPVADSTKDTTESPTTVAEGTTLTTVLWSRRILMMRFLSVIQERSEYSFMVF